MRQSETKLARERVARLLEGVECDLCSDRAVTAKVCLSGEHGEHVHVRCAAHPMSVSGVVPISEVLHLLVKE